MKRIFQKAFEAFFSKNFIVFVVIGILNTLINFLIYNLFLSVLNVHILLSTTIAFVIASTFSYFANAEYTYKAEVESKNLLYSVITFVFKLLLANLLTLFFEWTLIKINQENYKFLIPLPVTIVILPLQFIAFNVIFKNKKNKTDGQKKWNPNLSHCILLSIITLGIYYLYWISKIEDLYVKRLKCSKDMTLVNGPKLALMTMLTLGIYGIYWTIKVGKQIDSKKTKYFIFSILPLQIVSTSLIYNKIKKEEFA